MVILSTLAAVYGALVYRWHGGWGKAPRGLKNLACSLPLTVVACYPLYGHFSLYWLIPIALISLTLGMAGKATGHGGGMDMGTGPKEPGKGRSPEKLEYLILWLNGKLPPAIYDYILMVIIGMAHASGAAFALAFINPYSALLLLGLCGIFKATSYLISIRFTKSTETGEVLSGLTIFGTTFKICTGAA